ncbi:MAG TPA: hypothetical protein PKN33_05795 [Phycisphaerae bacterium]|nr:hypothetical protein [Phycisphaerae bacterium]
MDVVEQFLPLNLLAAAEPEGFTTPFLLAVLVMTPILILMTRRRLRKNRSNARSGRPNRNHKALTIERRAESIRSHNATESEAGAAMLEFQEYARTIRAQIDNRYQKLESATAHADQKIAELRKLLAQAGFSPSGTAPGVDPNVDVWHSIAEPRTQG